MDRFKYVITLLLLMATLSVNAQSRLAFARNESLPEQDVAAVVFKKIMANLAISADVVPMPPARAALENEHGNVAGEIARIKSYGIKHPLLIRIEPSYYYLTSVVFAKKNRQLNILKKEDLKNYRIGVLLGVQHSADLVAGLVNVDTVSSSESLFSRPLKTHLSNPNFTP